jgi:magnesium-transporting ATPase (P-type)
MEALRALEAPSATVVRDEVHREITAVELVPGDVILLEAGQSVPADARVIDAAEFRIVESSLTGEEHQTTDLTVVAFVGIADPLAADVPETVALLRGAGVRTVMLTGDQRLTAAAIVRRTRFGHHCRARRYPCRDRPGDYNCRDVRRGQDDPRP